MKFVADSMLGKLAKWLRILGYDTIYRSFYRPGVIDQLLTEDRFLLTRYEGAAKKYKNTVLIRADRVGAQLDELRVQLKDFIPNRSNWFSRCLICNTYLREIPPEEVRENVPEYIYYSNTSAIRACPGCGRYYWPGSHRTRMLNQLEKWGFIWPD